jgi:hypothetical protein
MANTQAMCTSFKVDLFNAVHAFNAANTPAHTVGTADSFKAALYLASATINATTTAYTATGEVTGAGYVAGGVSTGVFNAPASTSTTSFVQPTNPISYTGVTLSTSFDCVLIYNATQSNKAVSVHTFTAQTITAGTFTLTMPTNDSTNALLRIA